MKKLQQLSDTEVENVVFDVTSASLSEKIKEENIRIAWDAEGMPAWKKEEDVVFIQVSLENNISDKQRDRQIIDYDEEVVREVFSYQRVWNVKWIFYGPNSVDYAFLLKDSLFLQEVHDILCKKNLFMVTEIPQIIKLNEIFSDQWWKRTEFAVNLNEEVIVETETPFVLVAGGKILLNDGEEISKIKIND